MQTTTIHITITTSPGPPIPSKPMPLQHAPRPSPTNRPFPQPSPKRPSTASNPASFSSLLSPLSPTTQWELHNARKKRFSQLPGIEEYTPDLYTDADIVKGIKVYKNSAHKQKVYERLQAWKAAEERRRRFPWVKWFIFAVVVYAFSFRTLDLYYREIGEDFDFLGDWRSGLAEESGI